MGRPSVASLRRTPDKHLWPSRARPSRTGASFELVAACDGEDEFRIASTKKAAELFPNVVSPRSSQRLCRRIAARAETLASSRYARRVRDRVFSQIWRLVARYPGRVTTATVIKRGWEFAPEELDNLDLGKLLNGFLADLDRRGAGEAGGWLIAFVHGEYDTPSGIIRLHLHLITAGAIINVVDSLRKGRCYKYREGDSVRFRVRIDRKPLTDLPYPFTYCFKAYWPWKHLTMTANGKRRTRKHRRIPEPVHTQVLQFLDRHRLNDLIVLKHVSVKRGQLAHPNNRKGEK